MPPGDVQPSQGPSKCYEGAPAMSKSIRPRRKSKPAKPYPDFPLFPHATKRWAKKILGKMHSFWPWDDPQGALEKYQAQKDALYAGRRPVDPAEVFTVETLVNKFLGFKRHLRDTREITAQTFAEYERTGQAVISAFGWNRAVTDLRPADFETYRGK